MYAIETEGLTKRFGERTAVDGLSLQVPTGCVYGFLGPNGAGKTTTLRLLLGLLRPHAGTIRLLGHELRRDRIAAMRATSALVEAPALYEHMSGRANLDLTRGLLGLARSEVGRVLAVVNLQSAADRRVGGYSLGMKQRLALARALLGSPRLLLLDEPTNGLDPDGIASMRALIRDLPDRTGATVLMSSHLLGEVEQTATVVGLMHAGRLKVQDETAALIGGSGTTLVFELNDSVRGAARLAQAGAELAGSDGESLRVRLRPGEDPRRASAALNRLLVEAGVEVWRMAPEVRTLEQVYFEATGVPAREAA